MVLRRWREIGRRLKRMDRTEFLDRLRQEFGKRQDAALAWVGYDFARGLQAQAHNKAGNFFFTQDSVESIADLLRQRVPQFEEIVRQANQICQHRFDLLGYTAVDYGRPIDWHLDAVYGKRAPRKAFYKIRYLDYREVGDSKVTWELNRHQHFVTLAKAYRLTGDRRFADEVLQQWRHWQAENPYPIGINWASSLEAAFRSLSWIWTYHLLQGARGVPDIRAEWMRGLALHGRHIERYLSTYFSPNTHLLGEGVGLFFIGVLCPELKAAERWKSAGWKIILQEANRQVRGDGFHFEQSTYYHVYALDFFLHSAILAGINGIAIPKAFEDTVDKMLTALCLLGRGGGPPRFGDDDGGRLFDPRRNREEHLLDPLATGAILFHRRDYKSAARNLHEETLWLLGLEGVRQWDGLEDTPVSSKSAALQDAGFYLLAAEKSTQLVVDAGPLGTQSGGHGHADALSVCLQSHGNSLLIDPGTYEYVGPRDDRNLFRGTAMHNTLRVDGASQAEPATPFSWRRLTHSRVEQWIQAQNFDLLVATHDGYQQREKPIVHRRWVFSLKNGIYLVRDVAEGQGKHQLDLAWHLGPELQLVGNGVFRVKDAAQGLALMTVHRHGWAEEVNREVWSPAYGRKAHTTLLNFGTESLLPAEFTVLLVTLEKAYPSPRKFVRIEQKDSSDVQGYRYSGDGVECAFFFGERGRTWRLDSLSSDASFLCREKKTGSAEERLIVCGGSFAAVESVAELRCIRSVEWAELIWKEGSRAVLSSDPAAVEHEFSEAQQPDEASASSE